VPTSLSSPLSLTILAADVDCTRSLRPFARFRFLHACPSTPRMAQDRRSLNDRISVENPMKTILTAATLAVGLAAGAIGSQAQAETVWHYPYKGTPYATETTPSACVHRTRRGSGAYRVIRRRAGEKRWTHWTNRSCR